MFQRIEYKQLNARQKENFNFQKVAAKLADYGFNCMRFNDDWQGADFLACHIDGSSFMKVQLKGRLSIDQKYSGNNIHIAFNQNDKWYLYPHDELRDELLNRGLMANTEAWDKKGKYNWSSIPEHLFECMEKYLI